MNRSLDRDLDAGSLAAEPTARAELRLWTLASGSSGNALLLECGETRLLVDLGLELRRLNEALDRVGRRAEELSAVILTHEHGDHVRGVASLSQAHPGLPVFGSEGTLRAIAQDLGTALAFRVLDSGSIARVGQLEVLPFAVSHDAAQPLGFRIEIGDMAVGVATDLGVASRRVVAALQGCAVLVVEANHDEGMLWGGRYPAFLKRRIASPRGHLSNQQTAELVALTAGPALRHVVLAHLSKENNEPTRAIDAVAPALEAAVAVRLGVAHPTLPGDPIAVKARLDRVPDDGVAVDAAPSPRPFQPSLRQLGLFDGLP